MMNFNGRCCVLQPFDKGAHDKRYDDTVSPAIVEAGLEPYRVDRDDDAVIPIDTIHDEIKAATICLADITTRNPNVMYEVGYAVASNKDVILISSTQQTERFPFDLQHRGIIQYASESSSDFEKLKADIIKRIKAILRKQVTQEAVSVSPVKGTHGLQPNEIAALALVLANVDSSEDRVGTYKVKQDMEQAGYTRVASQLALTRLSRLGLVSAVEDHDDNGNEFVSYRVLPAGEDWLLENQDKLELRVQPTLSSSASRRTGYRSEDDVPF